LKISYRQKSIENISSPQISTKKGDEVLALIGDRSIDHPALKIWAYG
jgi:hypothetical protein